VDPQLIYAIPLIVGLAVGHWLPMPVLPRRLAAPVGITSIVLGLVVSLAAVRRFRAASTTLQPWESTTALVTAGPYRVSRNPIYLGYTLLYLGVVFWVNYLWPLVLLPLVFWLMVRWVITREEAYLDRRFGEAYRDYRHRVRRWL